MFPYLKEPCREQLPQEERQDIVKNVKAMLMHKLGNVVVNNTDNLLISSFVGVVTAGIYSNYFLIIGSVRQVFDQAMLGVAASVGNLGATEEKEKVGQVFDQLFFIRLLDVRICGYLSAGAAESFCRTGIRKKIPLSERDCADPVYQLLY